MRLIGLAATLTLMLHGVASATEWSRCMAQCQAAHDRMEPAYALWRKAFAELLEATKDQIESKWELRDHLLRLRPDLEPLPHFKVEGDEGKSLEQFKTCTTICGKP